MDRLVKRWRCFDQLSFGNNFQERSRGAMRKRESEYVYLCLRVFVSGSKKRKNEREREREISAWNHETKSFISGQHLISKVFSISKLERWGSGRLCPSPPTSSTSSARLVKARPRSGKLTSNLITTTIRRILSTKVCGSDWQTICGNEVLFIFVH